MQCVGARRPHMAMGTTSPDVVDISGAVSIYTTTKEDISMEEMASKGQQEQQQLNGLFVFLLT